MNQWVCCSQVQVQTVQIPIKLRQFHFHYINFKKKIPIALPVTYLQSVWELCLRHDSLTLPSLNSNNHALCIQYIISISKQFIIIKVKINGTFLRNQIIFCLRNSPSPGSGFTKQTLFILKLIEQKDRILLTVYLLLF